MKTELVYTDAVDTATSSAIDTLLYNRNTADLYVVWHHSKQALYVFSGVPQHVYETFLQAPSVGKVVQQSVVGVYPSKPFRMEDVKLVWKPNTKPSVLASVPTTTFTFTNFPNTDRRFTAVFELDGGAELTLEGQYPLNADVRGSFEAKANHLITKGKVRLKSLVEHFD